MQLKEGALLDLLKPIVDYINNNISKILPNGEIYIILIASGLIAYYIKNKYNWGKIAFLLLALTIYTSFRYYGVGGK